MQTMEIFVRFSVICTMKINVFFIAYRDKNSLRSLSVVNKQKYGFIAVSGHCKSCMKLGMSQLIKLEKLNEKLKNHKF